MSKNFIKTCGDMEIKTIYHISDIHIRQYQRMSEYEEVFKNLYEYLINDIKTRETKDSIIFIAGDILHSKTDLAPEEIMLAKDLITNLDSIAPLFIITGNHDMNINNDNRMDAITPLITGMRLNNTCYIQKTGVYYINNISISLNSLLDNKNVSFTDINDPDKYINIYTYHGVVDGCTVDGGFVPQHGIKIDESSMYNMAMLGDIHKRQYLSKNIAYSGSLIQQRMGETIDNHGLIKWDISDKKNITHEDVDIKNNYCYLNLYVADGVIEEEIDYTTIPKNVRLKLTYRDTELTSLKKIENELINIHGLNIISKTYNKDKATKNNICFKDDNLSNIQESIQDVEYQNDIIERYIKIKYPELDINDIKKIHSMNRKYFDDVDSLEFNYNTIWKLKRLEWSNLFAFGENNSIDFDNYNNIVGIFGANHAGKSSIIDILLFTLFGEFSKSSAVADAVNNRKDTFICKVEIIINGKLYTITRSGKIKLKKGQRSLSTSVEFNVENEFGEKEPLNKDDVRSTNKEIQKYIGLYDIITNTNISLQDDYLHIIKQKQSERKEFLNQLLGVEVFEKLHQVGKEDSLEIKTLLKTYEGLELENQIVELEAEIVKNNDEKIINQKEYNEKNTQITDKNKACKLLYSNKITIDDKYYKIDIDNVNSEIKNNEADLATEETKLKAAEASITATNDKISKLDGKKNVFSELETKNVIIEKDINELNKKVVILEKVLKINNDEDLNKVNVKLLKLSTNKSTKDEETTDLQSKLDIVTTEISKLEKSQKKSIYIDIESKYKTNELNIKTLNDLNNKITNILKDISNKNKELLYKFNISSCENCKENYIISKQNLIQDEIIELNNELKELNKKVSETIVDKELDKLYNDYTDIGKKLLEHNKKYTLLLKEEAELLESVRVIDKDIESFNNDINEYENSLDILKNNKSYQEEINLLEDSKNKNKLNISQYQSLINKTTNDLLLLKENVISINKKIADINTKLNTLNQDKLLYESNKSSDDKNKKMDEEILLIENKITNLNKDSVDINNKINNNIIIIDSTKIKIEELRELLVTIKTLEDKKRLLDIYIAIMSKNGIPLYILEDILPSIENKANNILSLLAGFNLKIYLEDDDVIIRMFYNGQEDYSIDIKGGSGFEKFIISLALRISISQVSNLPKCNFIWVDEGFGTMDSTNIGSLDELFSFMINEYELVIFISHIDSVKEYAYDNILIDIDGDFSKVISH